jgi:hypothetical protein
MHAKIVKGKLFLYYMYKGYFDNIEICVPTTSAVWKILSRGRLQKPPRCKACGSHIGVSKAKGHLTHPKGIITRITCLKCRTLLLQTKVFSTGKYEYWSKE